MIPWLESSENKKGREHSRPFLNCDIDVVDLSRFPVCLAAGVLGSPQFLVESLLLYCVQVVDGYSQCLCLFLGALTRNFEVRIRERLLECFLGLALGYRDCVDLCFQVGNGGLGALKQCLERGDRLFQRCDLVGQ